METELDFLSVAKFVEPVPGIESFSVRSLLFYCSRPQIVKANQLSSFLPFLIDGVDIISITIL